jgi:hypothetical protein
VCRSCGMAEPHVCFSLISRYQPLLVYSPKICCGCLSLCAAVMQMWDLYLRQLIDTKVDIWVSCLRLGRRLRTMQHALPWHASRGSWADQQPLYCWTHLAKTASVSAQYV